MEQLVVVTDFDGTLMHEDVGDTIMNALGVFEQEQTIEVSRRVNRKEIGSMQWISTAYSFLEGHKHQVDQVIDQVQPRSGALEFLDFCKKQEIPVIVLSDGMQYYIEQIVQKYKLQMDRIISNPITYLDDGSFSMGFQNPNPACRWCGCCKADVVRKLKAEGKRVIYIGDGTSDYYGSSFADWIFARGSLARFLKDDDTAFYGFESFHEVLEVLQTQLPAFTQGIADKKVDKGHGFCQF